MKLFSIVKKLSVERFAELQFEWPKQLFASRALVRGHKKIECILPHTPTIGQ